MIGWIRKKVRSFFTALRTRLKELDPHMPTIKDVKETAIKVVKAVYTAIFDFIKGCITHWETVCVIILATLGLTALLSSWPWLMGLALPAWIESELLLPVISTLIVWGLINTAQWRRKRREAKVPVVA